MAIEFNFDASLCIGMELGNVKITEEIGRGNKGIVFKGFQTNLRRYVAVKILPKISMKTESEKEMFSNEASIIAQLNHPNITPIIDLGETADFFYFVMNLIDGYDLNDLIRKRRRHPIVLKRTLSLYETFKSIIPVVDALDFAHHEGVVHCDIKPSNILLEERTGRPYLSDFGIAFNSDLLDSQTTGLIMGSPVYLAPEQAMGKLPDGRTDIYAIGMTIVKCLMGTVPRRKESPKEIFLRKINKPNTFLIKRPSQSILIDDELESIIYKCIAHNPDERYSSALELKEVLEDYQFAHRDIFTK